MELGYFSTRTSFNACPILCYTTIALMASSCKCRFQIINSIQKLQLLDEVSKYDLYYSLTYLLKWKPFEFKTCTSLHYLVLNFYQINKDREIQTHDRLVIKVLISCQRTNSTQKLKLLGDVPRYDLYYSLIVGCGVCVFVCMCVSNRVRRKRYCQSLLFSFEVGELKEKLGSKISYVPFDKRIFWGWKSTTIAN